MSERVEITIADEVRPTEGGESRHREAHRRHSAGSFCAWWLSLPGVAVGDRLCDHLATYLRGRGVGVEEVSGRRVVAIGPYDTVSADLGSVRGLGYSVRMISASRA